METKICVDCGIEKALSEYYVQSSLPGDRKHSCKICSNAKTTAWRLTNPEAWNKKNKAYRDRRRERVLKHYGNKCVCCSEFRPEFLGLDHINGGGTQHRQEVGDTYAWAVKHNFPDCLQILCHNCNDAKGFYGECPHVKERREMLSAQLAGDPFASMNFPVSAGGA